MRNNPGWSLPAALLLAACQRTSADPASHTTSTAASTAITPPAAPSASVPAPAAGGSLYDLEATRLDGHPEKLAVYRGKVALVVNTASECGYTPQYEGLQALHKKYEGKGFTVLGFPSNDFGGQEPGSSSQIATFCQSKYGVSFPLFDKVVTRGPGAAPVYRLLGAAGGTPQWNFHKYLVGKDGKLRRAFPSAVTPESDELRAAIEAALAEPG